MQLTDAKNMATQLMNKHGLSSKGWYFEFDNAKHRFGCCNHRYRRISLSKHLVLLNDEARVTNIILHEIAHALVGRGHGHDIVWRTKAIEIGCDGERCFSTKDVKMAESRLQATCKKCGHVHKRERMPKNDSSCGVCSRVFDRDNLLVFKPI